MINQTILQIAKDNKKIQNEILNETDWIDFFAVNLTFNDEFGNIVRLLRYGPISDEITIEYRLNNTRRYKTLKLNHPNYFIFKGLIFKNPKLSDKNINSLPCNDIKKIKDIFDKDCRVGDEIQITTRTFHIYIGVISKITYSGTIYFDSYYDLKNAKIINNTNGFLKSSQGSILKITNLNYKTNIVNMKLISS